MSKELLSDDAITEALSGLPGWERDGATIIRFAKLPSFREAIATVDAVADLAESANHHPDIDIRYRKVRTTLTTHDAGGLSQKDLDLAADIDASVDS
jgi:4a-hydroxytetrahydrobiopterin dehydratase